MDAGPWGRLSWLAGEAYAKLERRPGALLHHLRRGCSSPRTHQVEQPTVSTSFRMLAPGGAVAWSWRCPGGVQAALSLESECHAVHCAPAFYSNESTARQEGRQPTDARVVVLPTSQGLRIGLVRLGRRGAARRRAPLSSKASWPVSVECNLVVSGE